MSNEDQTKTGNATSKNMVSQTLSGTKSITPDPTAAAISEQSLRELSNAEAIAHLKAGEAHLDDVLKKCDIGIEQIDKIAAVQKEAGLQVFDPSSLEEIKGLFRIRKSVQKSINRK